MPFGSEVSDLMVLTRNGTGKQSSGSDEVCSSMTDDSPRRPERNLERSDMRKRGGGGGGRGRGVFYIVVVTSLWIHRTLIQFGGGRIRGIPRAVCKQELRLSAPQASGMWLPYAPPPAWEPP